MTLTQCSSVCFWNYRDKLQTQMTIQNCLS